MNDIKIIKTEILSKEWSLLKRVTFEYLQKDGSWQTQKREIYERGNVYCASKAAVEALSKSMRIDLLPHRIKVTAIHPGAAETEFAEVRFKGDKEKAKKVYEGFEPLSATDVAETIWFIASRPAHVNINDLVLMPTAQATASNIFRKNS